MKCIKLVVGLLLLGILYGCGGGGGSSGAASSSTSTPGSPAAVTAVPSISLEVRNSSSAVTSSISALDIFTLRATVRNAAGSPVSGQVVRFADVSGLVKFSSSSGTGLTDASGVATVQVGPATSTSSGAGNLTADVAVAGVDARQATVGVQVIPLASGGSASITLEMLDPSSVLATTIAALDTNILRARVRDSLGNPLPAQIVTFSSSLGLSKFGPASSVLTDISGIATVTVKRNQPTSVGAEVISAAVSVGGIAVTPAAINVSVSPLVSGGVPSMTLGLRDLTNVSTSIVARGSTTFAHVQLSDATGAVPPPTVVTLTGDASLIAFTASGLSDNTGVARIAITVVPASVGGASTLRASATISGTPVAAAFDFQVPTGANAGAPTLTLGIVGGGNSVSASGLTVARATVTDASGAAVAGKLVTFSGNSALIKFSPASGQVLTDVSGLATIQVAPVSLTSAGASTLVAQTTVGASALSASFDFQLAAANLGLQGLNLGAGPLAAFGNRPISVVATVNGSPATNTPVQVSFNATCGTVTPSAVTTDANGIASTTYSASLATCAGTNVTVTATAVGAVPVSGTVAVASSIATNIQFISTTPPRIFLKDSVGPTQAQVIFKVVDSGGNALQNKNVRLALSNEATGISLNTVGNTAPVDLTTDSAGQVNVAVFSGTVPTSLNIRATLVDNASVFTNSNILTVAVGRPTQRSLSLSREKFSIEGRDFDGTTTKLTLSLADRQGNPVPAGTQVNLVSESGVMLPPICFVQVQDTTSFCSVEFRSQGTRTSNGRVSIMAYVEGEEDFVDVNGNNVFDNGEPFADLGRAFRDDNGSNPAGANGSFDAGEFQVPRLGAPACTSLAGCLGDGAWGTADVRTQTTLVLASSNALISTSPLNATTPFPGSSPITNTLTAVTVTVSDINGNSMPTGSTIAVSVIDDGFQVPGFSGGTTCSVTGTASFTVANSLAPKVIEMVLQACTVGDKFKVRVTSPSGFITEQIFAVQ